MCCVFVSRNHTRGGSEGRRNTRRPRPALCTSHSLLGASSGKLALPSFLLLLLLLSSCSVQHSSRSSRSSHLPLIRASSAGARPSVPIVLYPDVLADGFFSTAVSQVE